MSCGATTREREQAAREADARLAERDRLYEYECVTCHLCGERVHESEAIIVGGNRYACPDCVN